LANAIIPMSNQKTIFVILSAAKNLSFKSPKFSILRRPVQNDRKKGFRRAFKDNCRVGVDLFVPPALRVHTQVRPCKNPFSIKRILSFLKGLRAFTPFRMTEKRFCHSLSGWSKVFARFGLPRVRLRGCQGVSGEFPLAILGFQQLRTSFSPIYSFLPLGHSEVKF
jgi:hypothetical protein